MLDFVLRNLDLQADFIIIQTLKRAIMDQDISGPADSSLLLRELNTALPMRRISQIIDRLDVSADTKALLMDLARITMKVGQTVLHLGRKILSFVVEVVTSFPGTSFGAVLALVVTSLVASVPLVGPPLAAFISPLFLAFGLTMGAISDLKNDSWVTGVEKLKAQLSGLSA